MIVVWKEESSKYIDNMLNLFKDGLASGILRSVVMAEEKAKKRFIQGQNADKSPPIPWPVKDRLTSRTGRLRASIKHGVGNDIGWLKTNVSYGYIHEISGVNEEGVIIGLRPFLSPAFTENWEKIKEKIAEEIVMEMAK